MPIKITDYTWSQRKSSLFIDLSLRNCSSKNVDIVCTSLYIKVNFTPYIFEVFLQHEIRPETSTSLIKGGLLHFHLIKAVSDEWESLEIIPASKEKAQSLRAAALKEYEELEKKASNERKEHKRTVEQLAIAKQISVNEEQHLLQKEFIQQEEEKFFAEAEYGNVETLSKADRLRLSSLCSEDGSLAPSEGGYEGDEESTNFSSTENLTGMGMTSTESASSPKKLNTKCREAIGTPPGIRQPCVIRIQHTPHRPNVPRRTSKADSYDEGICQPEEGGEIEGSESANKEREELKGEASKCFGRGDFEEALKCYSKLIDILPLQPSNYSNRAAVYVAMKSYQNAINDCSKALNLLSPATPENAKSNLLCHVRRGTSHVRMGNLSSALRDFEAALRLDPNNVSLAKDAAVIRASLNAYTDSTDEAEETDPETSTDDEEEEEEYEEKRSEDESSDGKGSCEAEIDSSDIDADKAEEQGRMKDE